MKKITYFLALNLLVFISFFLFVSYLKWDISWFGNIGIWDNSERFTLLLIIISVLINVYKIVYTDKEQ